MHGTNSTLSWGSGSLGRAKLFNIQFVVKICEFSIGGKSVFIPVLPKIVALRDGSTYTNEYKKKTILDKTLEIISANISYKVIEH
jgi:hypothetical protein